MALFWGILALCKQNKQSLEALARTSPGRVRFNSNNDILGTGPDGEGMDLVGKAMMPVRELTRVFNGIRNGAYTSECMVHESHGTPSWSGLHNTPDDTDSMALLDCTEK
ncbi:hypothetical protein DACRYDRAFT_112582 [Dacryopinax primogenitus]|uniref:Uncharacterized protein n=1 Tax=Dacryopinax primogenitus (strain DJM 731) TaxID=1858805 RepID=M5FNY0_DACPD|nr:uncharacterized protein DACRYDRAFT_112582 [Dacryopinax primogenitus]EJT96633.1 hypothetical protein DACRYDRAFT_112582 [Dacryopinax primogenitus]